MMPQRRLISSTLIDPYGLTSDASVCLIRVPVYPIDGQVAQSVEQGTENPRVGSSILSLATI